MQETMNLPRSTARAPLRLLPSVTRRLRRIWSQLRFDAGAISVRLVDDQEMRRLNKQFRHQDRVTDVLTFVYGNQLPRPRGRGMTRKIRLDSPVQGDLVIAIGRARQQARRRGLTLEDELLRLAVHGCTHLAGYTHEARGSFMHMRQREFELLIQIL